MTTDNRPKQIGIMKAKPIEDRYVTALGPKCFAQRKFRGQSCSTRWVSEEESILVSSYGNLFYFMEHIHAYLSNFPPLPYIGELYCHDMTQQEINSICSRTVNPHEDTKRIQYVIYDLATGDPQSLRLMRLDRRGFPSLGSSLPVVYAGYELITPGYWPHYAQKYLKEGYEGLILRDLYAPYSPLDPQSIAKRPSTILKFKPTETDEYKIIDCIEGTGWAEGRLGSFLVEDDNGVQFFVGTGKILTKPGRRDLWQDKDSLIGKTLIVKHEANINTADGIPICTSAWEVR